MVQYAPLEGSESGDGPREVREAMVGVDVTARRRVEEVPEGLGVRDCAQMTQHAQPIREVATFRR